MKRAKSLSVQELTDKCLIREMSNLSSRSASVGEEIVGDFGRDTALELESDLIDVSRETLLILDSHTTETPGESSEDCAMEDDEKASSLVQPFDTSLVDKAMDDAIDKRKCELLKHVDSELFSLPTFPLRAESRSLSRCECLMPEEGSVISISHLPLTADDSVLGASSPELDTARRFVHSSHALSHSRSFSKSSRKSRMKAKRRSRLRKTRSQSVSCSTVSSSMSAIATDSGALAGSRSVTLVESDTGNPLTTEMRSTATHSPQQCQSYSRSASVQSSIGSLAALSISAPHLLARDDDRYEMPRVPPFGTLSSNDFYSPPMALSHLSGIGDMLLTPPPDDTPTALQAFYASQAMATSAPGTLSPLISDGMDPLLLSSSVAPMSSAFDFPLPQPQTASSSALTAQRMDEKMCDSHELGALWTQQRCMGMEERLAAQTETEPPSLVTLKVTKPRIGVQQFSAALQQAYHCLMTADGSTISSSTLLQLGRSTSDSILNMLSHVRHQLKNPAETIRSISASVSSMSLRSLEESREALAFAYRIAPVAAAIKREISELSSSAMLDESSEMPLPTPFTPTTASKTGVWAAPGSLLRSTTGSTTISMATGSRQVRGGDTPFAALFSEVFPQELCHLIWCFAVDTPMPVKAYWPRCIVYNPPPSGSSLLARESASVLADASTDERWPQLRIWAAENHNTSVFILGCDDMSSCFEYNVRTREYTALGRMPLGIVPHSHEVVALSDDRSSAIDFEDYYNQQHFDFKEAAATGSKCKTRPPSSKALFPPSSFLVLGVPRMDSDFRSNLESFISDDSDDFDSDSSECKSEEPKTDIGTVDEKTEMTVTTSSSGVGIVAEAEAEDICEDSEDEGDSDDESGVDLRNLTVGDVECLSQELCAFMDKSTDAKQRALKMEQRREGKEQSLRAFAASSASVLVSSSMRLMTAPLTLSAAASSSSLSPSIVGLDAFEDCAPKREFARHKQMRAKAVATAQSSLIAATPTAAGSGLANFMLVFNTAPKSVDYAWDCERIQRRVVSSRLSVSRLGYGVKAANVGEYVHITGFYGHKVWSVAANDFIQFDTYGSGLLQREQSIVDSRVDDVFGLKRGITYHGFVHVGKYRHLLIFGGSDQSREEDRSVDTLYCLDHDHFEHWMASAAPMGARSVDDDSLHSAHSLDTADAGVSPQHVRGLSAACKRKASKPLSLPLLDKRRATRSRQLRRFGSLPFATWQPMGARYRMPFKLCTHCYCVVDGRDPAADRSRYLVCFGGKLAFGVRTEKIIVCDLWRLFEDWLSMPVPDSGSVAEDSAHTAGRSAAGGAPVGSCGTDADVEAVGSCGTDAHVLAAKKASFHSDYWLVSRHTLPVHSNGHGAVYVRKTGEIHLFGGYNGSDDMDAHTVFHASEFVHEIEKHFGPREATPSRLKD